jgi:hypothetical protein
MARERQLIDKVEALKLASLIGCSGAHRGEDGGWMPCTTHEEMIKVSNRAEKYIPKKKSDELQDAPKKKKKRFMGKRGRRRNGFEKLGERGISGIVSIDSGIVAAPPGPMIVSGKAARIGPEYVRETDPDVFLDPESARVRSRQLGCIGISRRVSKNGRAVWMPCTNMSDYSRLSGTTSLGRRRRREEERRRIRSVIVDMSKRRGRKSIAEELGYKVNQAHN